ncbi:hypothetical protein V5799_021998 [Amblyomma americanum]|uniref:Ubiquitin-conjugating enzyme E2 Z n=1 Tax=Amblyomma americanum TaxID=6943 RepID=A0AAQ4FM89_AMBAM
MARRAELQLKPLNYWDPISYQHEQPSPLCMLRVKRDIAEIYSDPPIGLTISPNECDITRIHALVVGPSGTPYEGGFFHFLLKCPPDYPMSPPRVRLMTTDGGQVTFNPHLYSNGKVCLSILGTFEGPSWSPAQSIGSVLISIQSIMSENPFEDDLAPVSAHGRNPGISCGLNTTVFHETIRVAVCDTVEACISNSTDLPRDLVEAVMKSFAENHIIYEDLVKAQQHMSGRTMAGGGSIVPVGSTYGFGLLLARLRSLYDRVSAGSVAATPSGDAGGK